MYHTLLCWAVPYTAVAVYLVVLGCALGKPNKTMN